MSGLLGKSYKIIWQQISSRVSASFLRCQRFSQSLLSLFALLSPSSAGECGGQAIYCMCPSFSGKTKSLSGMENPEFSPKALTGGYLLLHPPGAVPSQSPGSLCGSCGQQCPGNSITGMVPSGQLGRKGTSHCARTRNSPALPRGAAGSSSRQTGRGKRHSQTVVFHH